MTGIADKRRPAFTLIELLVVVAIISLLIAILLPSLQAARSQAKRATCGARLHDIGNGWRMYLHENRDQFYRAVNAQRIYGGQQGAGSRWFGLVNPIPRPLNPYLGLPLIVGEFEAQPDGSRARRTTNNAEVFHCPADTGSEEERPTAYEFFGTSYRTNIMLVGQDDLDSPTPDNPCAEVFRAIASDPPARPHSRMWQMPDTHAANPSKLILLGDEGWARTWWYSDFSRNEWHDRRRTHNVGFLDGHVDFLRLRKGIHVDEAYVTIPFADLIERTIELQVEVPYE